MRQPRRTLAQASIDRAPGRQRARRGPPRDVERDLHHAGSSAARGGDLGEREGDPGIAPGERCPTGTSPCEQAVHGAVRSSRVITVQ